MELDLLGEQVMLALRFQESGFDPELELQDEVENQTARARILFSDSDGRWFMRSESIPGHLGIKAIAVDQENLYLETSPIKVEDVRRAIVDRMLPFTFQDDGFVDVTTGKQLIFLGPVTKPEIEELGLRRLWTIPTHDLDGLRRSMVVRMVDTIYSVDAYEVEEVEVSSVPVISQASVQRLSQQLQIGLQQRMLLEQRPVLSLSTRTTGEQTQIQTLELRQIMALNHQLLRMGADELPDFFSRFIEKHGEKAALRVAIFAVAGKVKAAKPSLSWREARQVARKLLHAA
ncbi:MAG: hypothetical protein NTX96_02665 [Candidatus Zambryskibacteria bacterium]|nr:hypothetical protein [Candidatus Zambryskibacteria bacterium]